jgi:branched-chain amino acid aminotransferase
MKSFSLRPMSFDEAMAALPSRPWHARLYAMYSSVWDGVVTDPRAMVVPADDHVVHRGDGVFETLKCVDGAVYAMKAHFARLAASAERIRMEVPFGMESIGRAVRATIQAGRHRDCAVRVLLSRGPGGLGVSPRECPEPQLYVVAYHLPPPFMSVHPEGARAVTTTVPLKPDYFAAIKTCNYLPNALMKLAAEEAGADFPLALDERGCLAEGATENFGIVDAAGNLVTPRPGRILDGITMRRAVTLAARLVRLGTISGVVARDIPGDELYSAREVLVFGTTPDVTAVVALDGIKIGGGRPGPVQQALRKLLEDDQRTNSALRTMVFE